jgi:hypothetical protein
VDTGLASRISFVSEAPEDVPRAELESLLSEGFAEALKLDSERLALERRITVLAASADEPEPAQELRRVWLRHRTLKAELTELRASLSRLSERLPGESKP